MGKVFVYINFGYYLLDVLLQAELGKSWCDLLQEKVFGFLDMEYMIVYVLKVSILNEAVFFDGLYLDKLLFVYLRKVDVIMYVVGGLMIIVEDVVWFLICYFVLE